MWKIYINDECMGEIPANSGLSLGEELELLLDNSVDEDK